MYQNQFFLQTQREKKENKYDVIFFYFREKPEISHK